MYWGLRTKYLLIGLPRIPPQDSQVSWSIPGLFHTLDIATDPYGFLDGLPRSPGRTRKKAPRITILYFGASRPSFWVFQASLTIHQAILILKPVAQGPGDGARGAIAWGLGAEPLPYPRSPKMGTLRAQGPEGPSKNSSYPGPRHKFPQQW